MLFDDLPLRSSGSLRRRKLFLDDRHGLPVQSGRTPAKILLHPTRDAGIEQGEHHAEDARIGVDAAHGRTPDAKLLQFPDRRRRKSVSLLRQHDIAILRLDQQVEIGRAGDTTSLLEPGAKERTPGIHKAREDPSLEATRTTSHPFDKFRRRRKCFLQVDYDQGLHVGRKGASQRAQAADVSELTVTAGDSGQNAWAGADARMNHRGPAEFRERRPPPPCRAAVPGTQDGGASHRPSIR